MIGIYCTNLFSLKILELILETLIKTHFYSVLDLYGFFEYDTDDFPLISIAEKGLLILSIQSLISFLHFKEKKNSVCVTVS